MLLQSIVYKMRTYDCPCILKSSFHNRSNMIDMRDVGCFFRNIFLCIKRTWMRIFYWEWVMVMRIWCFSWQHLGFWKTVCEPWFFRIVAFRFKILCMRYQKILQYRLVFFVLQIRWEFFQNFFNIMSKIFWNIRWWVDCCCFVYLLIEVAFFKP